MAFKVTDGVLNVRTGPSLSELTVNVVREGDIVEQVVGSQIVTEVARPEPAPTKTWIRINHRDLDGWTLLDNLKILPDGGFEVTAATGSPVQSEPSIPTPTIVGNLDRGSVVLADAMVAETSNPSFRRWVRLDLAPQKSGWASMLLLTPTAGPVTLSQTKYRVTADRLHVRSDPLIDSNIVGSVIKDTTLSEGKITVQGDRRWMQIATPPGFVSMKFLSKVSAVPTVGPTWHQIAKGEEGTKEFLGDADNPEVVKYLKSCATLSGSLQRNDETAWCSAFVNWCVEQAGFEGTESAAARSWARWGKSIPDPELGCIVVLSRGSNPAKGHVGFFVKQDPGRVFLLGGNQHDSVNVTAFDKRRVLMNGFRMNLP